MTRLACIILIIVALHNKGIYWWIAPIYKISDIGWALFKGIVRPLRATIKEGDRKPKFRNRYSKQSKGKTRTKRINKLRKEKEKRLGIPMDIQ